MAIVIGSGDNAYYYNPENPGETTNKVNPNTGVTYSMSGNIHSNDPVEMVRNEPFIPGPSSPAPEDQLQFLIDNKNKLTGIQGVNPELNAYQEAIQNFRTSDPMNMAAYANRFPLTNFMMTAPNKIAENTLFGQVLSAMNTGKDKAKEFASGLFPQGFMPGLGQTFSDIKEDAKNVIPAVTKDLNTFTGLFRNITDTKKNTAEDIAPGVLTETKAIKNEGGLFPTDVKITNLPIQNLSPEPGTLEFIQEQGKKNVESFPSYLTFDQYGQAVKKRLGLQ